MEWQPSDVIALTAVLMSPIGGLLVAWYTAYRQDRAQERQDLKGRRADVEDALAEVEKVRSVMTETVAAAMIRLDEPQLDAKPVDELVPRAEQAVEKLAHARVRHPDEKLGEALWGLIDRMRTLSWWADLAAKDTEQFPPKNVAESLGRRERAVREHLDEAEERLYAYHGEEPSVSRPNQGFA